MANDLLLYNNNYWEEKLGPKFRRHNLENELHLIFSLLVFLEISLAQFLTFTFSSKSKRSNPGQAVSWDTQRPQTMKPPASHPVRSGMVRKFPKVQTAPLQDDQANRLQDSRLHQFGSCYNHRRSSKSIRNRHPSCGQCWKNSPRRQISGDNELRPRKQHLWKRKKDHDATGLINHNCGEVGSKTGILPELLETGSESHFWRHVDHGCTGTSMLPKACSLCRIFVNDKSIDALRLRLLGLAVFQSL